MAVAKILCPAGHGARLTHAILSRDRTEDDEKFCTALPIHLHVQSMHTHTHSISPSLSTDEAPILFPPTYRFARGRHSLDDYVWVKQKRSGIRLNVPSYCDRVLWCSYPETIITNSSYGVCV